MSDIEKQVQNVFAFNFDREVKHISEVERGRKGYYCMGCGELLEARKGEKKAHYFAHVPTNVEQGRKCTYSDETYRHKIAKEILQRIKKVKVPALYKYPPYGQDGEPRKIRNGRMINAHKVRIECQFYEDENGIIKHGKSIDFSKKSQKHLLIQPDVAFFDIDGKPILLIEIVATHKIDETKLSKIKRLGIDTIQITIPKSSPQEIENTFSKTSRTQWIFNYEQEKTNYFHLPKGNIKGLPPIDKFQRSLFKAAESYACRSSYLKNVIRGLRKHLASEQYHQIEGNLRMEISRVEKNTEDARERMRRIQGDHRNAASDKYKSQERELEQAERAFEQEEETFRKRVKDLDRRYQQKKDEIESTYREYRASCQNEIERIARELEQMGATGASFEKQIGEIDNEERDIIQWFKGESDKIRELTERERQSIQNAGRRRIDLPSKYGKLEEELRSHIEERGRRIRNEEKEVNERIRSRFEKLRRQAITAIEEKHTTGNDRIHKRIRETLSSVRLLLSISEGQESLRRLKHAKKVLESGAYKKWT